MKKNKTVYLIIIILFGFILLGIKKSDKEENILKNYWEDIRNTNLKQSNESYEKEK
tara:strand:+ start:3383 stop:3550 length:168 start_codon:yes stop_codon:yes gene_type:complete